MGKSLGVLCMVAALGAGCASRLVDGGGRGGGGAGGQGGVQTDPCANLVEAACKASPACRAEYCSACACAPAYVGCAGVGAAPRACTPLQSCPGSTCSCSGLDEADCKAADPALGCTPAYCPDTCDGGQTFAACRGPNDAAPACGGATGCRQSGCHDNPDCGQGTRCAPAGCGGCQLPLCTDDSQCGSGQVCGWDSCCQSMRCVPRCSEDSCGPQQYCNNGYCIARTCAGAGACAPDFDCIGELCTRRECNRDGDCDSGHACVLGFCRAMPGVCVFP